VAVRRNVDLMQAPRWSAERAACTAEMLVMQNDRLQVVTKLGEGVKGCRRTAKTIKRAANLRRKTVDVLRTVTIFNMMAAAFRQRLAAGP
jgi:hypothetical protein